MGCWHGCLSGARCRLAYVHIFDAIATHSVASGKSRLVLPFWYQLIWVVLEKGPLNGCVCTCHFFLTYLSPSLVIFPFENRPAPLDAVKKRLNLALVFLCLFCVVRLFWSMNACFSYYTRLFYGTSCEEHMIVRSSVTVLVN